MNKSILATIGLAALLFVCCSAAGIPEDEPTSTTTVANTYFGVDANDAEAVRQKQRELNAEKFKELFGDLNLDELNFSPELDLTDGKGEKFVGTAHDIIMDVFGRVHDMFFVPPSTTTSTTPSTTSQ